MPKHVFTITIVNDTQIRTHVMGEWRYHSAAQSDVIINPGQTGILTMQGQGGAEIFTNTANPGAKNPKFWVKRRNVPYANATYNLSSM